MNGFDTYLLAANVAQFPLPVITGIGHDRDETVLDLVANVRCKTPTAVADFLIERLSKELELLENCAATLKVCAQNKLNAQLQRMDSFVALIPLVFSRVIDKEKARYRILSERLPNAIQNVCRGERSRCERLVMRMEMNTKSMIANMQNRLLHVSERLQFVVPAVLSRQKQRLESCERGIRLAQPERVLKLGFSLTLKDGKAVTDASQLSPGDRIVTRLSNGEVTSRVE